MPSALPPGLSDTLLWSDELGYGWHPREPMSYEGDYFAKYQALDKTPMGEALTAARVELVARYIKPSHCLDIGIGGGAFVKAADCWGFDVSESAKRWLISARKWSDPRDYEMRHEAMTFWDSLEHIPRPETELSLARKWAFVSMPTYESATECLASKHYKPGEHIHYFSVEGFCKWAEKQGFEVVEINRMETNLGREGITTFVLQRIHG